MKSDGKIAQAARDVRHSPKGKTRYYPDWVLSNLSTSVFSKDDRKRKSIYIQVLSLYLHSIDGFPFF